MIQCYMFVQSLSNKVLCKKEQKGQYQHAIGDKSGASFICTRDMLIFVFCFPLWKDFVQAQILHEHVALHHIYLYKIFGWFLDDCFEREYMGALINSIESIGSYMPTRVQTTRLAPYA